jgi:hypothetical protein
MKRERNNLIPLAGYVPLNRLLEINRDALRATPKNEKQEVCKALISELILWSSYSDYEAVGVLEAIKHGIILSNLKE